MGSVISVGIVEAEEAGIIAHAASFTGVTDDGGNGELSLEDLFERADPE
jgi:hypothetical protein